MILTTQSTLPAGLQPPCAALSNSVTREYSQRGFSELWVKTESSEFPNVVAWHVNVAAAAVAIFMVVVDALRLWKN